MGIWKHRKRSKNDTTPDPTESAFFSNETVGDISTALIREGVQNVLDEIKDCNRPAKITITHSGNKYAISPDNIKNLVGELIPHLQAEKNGIIKSELPDFSQQMPFLIFEDFNTNGLEGDPAECLYTEYNDKSKPHNLYFFWRSYGRSGKHAGKMGSWGVGKSVFPSTSKINTFWALTVRESDKEALLLGQSVLKTHDRIDLPAPYGYFPWGSYGVHDQEDFVMPETSIEEIRKFKKLFRLKREITEIKKDRESNTGLSLIIPYPKTEVTLESLVLSTIKQFFFPIITGKLEVEIVYEDEKIELKKGTLKHEIEKINFTKLPEIEQVNKARLLSLFELTEWIITLNKNKHTKLNISNPNRAYRWTKELFDKIDLKPLQEKFEKGECIPFIIPVKYQPEGEEAEIREFCAYLKKDDLQQEPESIFIRDSITITGIKSLKRKGVRGLVIISDSKLVTFFGQAEGPAHTGWHKDNFRVKFENAEEIISFVQRSLHELYNKLLTPPEGLDTTLLSDLFFIESPGESTGNNGGFNSGQKKTIAPKLDLPTKPKKKFTLFQVENGFKITNNPEFMEAIEKIRITLAYDRPDGNPFHKYSALDFNVKHLHVEEMNIDLETFDLNVIEFVPLNRIFEFKITGFDKNRDLIVNIT